MRIGVITRLALVAFVACKFPYPGDVPDDSLADATTDAQPCTAGAPDAGSCRACIADDECPSNFCQEGVCAPPGRVLFVRPDGVDGANGCTDPGMPCRTVGQALVNVPPTGGTVATRRYISLMAPGSYVEPTTLVIDDKTVVIRGAAPVGSMRSVLVPMGGVGIVNGAAARLERLAISAPTAGGIICTRATVYVDDVNLVDNRATGLRGEQCTVTLLDSLVARNAGGGVSVEGERAVIVNNVFVENGEVLSAFGAMRISSVIGSSVIQSNTLVANRAATGQADGVDCTAINLRLRNHIIFGDAMRAHVVGTCIYDHTLYGPDDPGGRLGTANGNRLVANDADFRFVDPARGDYHISSASVAKGSGTSTGLAPESSTDLDGQARPQGAPDVGADEIPD